jgi:hypothetical protein
MSKSEKRKSYLAAMPAGRSYPIAGRKAQAGKKAGRGSVYKTLTAYGYAVIGGYDYCYDAGFYDHGCLI